MLPKIKQIAGKLDTEINLFEPGQKLIGVDIGTTSVKVVAVKEAPVGTRLLGIGISEILPAKEDDEEDKKDKISTAIKNAFTQLGINARRVNTIFNSPSLNIKNLNLPTMPEEELKESVKWEMEQNVNFTIDAATIDFLVSGEVIRSGAKNLELEVIAALTNDIKNHMQIYIQNKMNIASINIPSFCLWNIFQKSNQWKEDDTIALIDIGAKITRINIFSNNILRFTREIYFGGDTVTENLAREMNLPLYEAEKTKIEYGLSEKFAQFEIISESFKQLAAQIDRSFGYYKAQFHIERIDRMVIYGGTSKLANLDRFLSDQLGIFVEIGNPFNGLLFDQRAFANLEEFTPFFSMAIGAALNSGDVKRINLLPDEYRKDHLAEVKKKALKIAPVAIIFFFLIVYINLIRLEKRFVREKVEKEVVISAWKEQNQLEEKLNSLNAIWITQESWKKTFKGLGAVIPEGVWLNLITLDEKNKLLVLKGAGENNILVIKFVRNLESLPYFSSVMLESVEEKSEEKTPYTYFKIRIKK